MNILITANLLWKRLLPIVIALNPASWICSSLLGTVAAAATETSRKCNGRTRYTLNICLYIIHPMLWGDGNHPKKQPTSAWVINIDQLLDNQYIFQDFFIAAYRRANTQQLGRPEVYRLYLASMRTDRSVNPPPSSTAAAAPGDEL